jgi:hypothetical protein
MAVPSQGVRQLAAVTVYVLAVGWGVHSAVGRADSPTEWVVPIGLALACTVWCASDAAARHLSLVWPARIGILLFWPVGAPAYMVWSRGARGLGKAAVAVVGWLLVMFAAFTLTGYLAYGSAWFNPPGR